MGPFEQMVEASFAKDVLSERLSTREAFQMGQEAYHNGTDRAPAMNPEFIAKLGEFGSNKSQLKAYIRGWDTASLNDPQNESRDQISEAAPVVRTSDGMSVIILITTNEPRPRSSSGNRYHLGKMGSRYVFMSSYLSGFSGMEPERVYDIVETFPPGLSMDDAIERWDELKIK